MAELPILYELRQNKFVSRSLFVELLRRVDRFRGLGDYAYFGLGGPTLEDHRILHAQFGMTRLISIEMDEATYRRQEFNKPISCIRCLRSTTKDIIDNYHTVREDLDLPENASTIVWLDYAKPREVGSQLDELQALLSYSAHGDIIRITVNAHPSALDTNLGKHPLADDIHRARLEKLQDRLGRFCPSDVEPKDMHKSKLPTVFFRAIRTAAIGALPARLGREFVPLLLESYADGQQMACATGVVLNSEGKDDFFGATGLSEWEFYADNWAHSISINIPPLTTRERFWLDQQSMDTDGKPLSSTLSFLPGSERDIEDTLLEYKKYYRFYPQFHHVIL